MSKYSIGVDFGTLSGRAVIVDINTGDELASAVMEYEHGVMSQSLPDGTQLPEQFALQHPQDYLDVLETVIKEVFEKSGISNEDVVGVGVDFTASTILPVTSDGTPLCFLDEFKNDPHAYVKLWKHHAAQKESEEISAVAAQDDPNRLARYGGVISSEWMFPKILQILKEDEKVYDKTFRFIEAADWIVCMLTGVETHSVCTTGFKAMWDDENGYPDKAFLKKLNPKLENIVGDKISENIIGMNMPAGKVTDKASEQFGLRAGTPVAPGIIDAHAALPAVGITDPGKILLIIGTSSCHILLDKKEIFVPGISGVVKNGIVDGLYAYEAGQSCVGDSFDWFIKNCVSSDYLKEAENSGENIHAYLRNKAKKLLPGESGLLALDWWNGNRTPFVDADLSGVILGMTINTKPEEIYRALIEATAFGTRLIIDIYEENGIHIDEIYAAGGIAEKDSMLMQIYSDVTGRTIKISGTPQAGAHGSAVFGAVSDMGYSNISDASDKMSKIKDIVYEPVKNNTLLYNTLYDEYKKLINYFGSGENNVMKTLKVLSKEAKTRRNI